MIKPRLSFCQWSNHVRFLTTVLLPMVKTRPSSRQWSKGCFSCQWSKHVRPLAIGQTTSVLYPVVKPRPSFTQWSNHGRPLPSGQTTSVLLPMVKPRPCSENHAYRCRTVPLCQWSNHACPSHGECVSCQWSNRVRVQRIVPLSCGQTTSVS